jgi:hypothetical protein
LGVGGRWVDGWMGGWVSGWRIHSSTHPLPFHPSSFILHPFLYPLSFLEKLTVLSGTN